MYSRSIAFYDRFMNICGKTTCPFPDEYIEIIRAELKDKDITYDNVLNILKKHNWNKYYEFVPHILELLGLPIVKFTEEQERLIFELFDKINCTDAKVMPYFYILYKLAEYIKYEDLHLFYIKPYFLEKYEDDWNTKCLPNLK